MLDSGFTPHDRRDFSELAREEAAICRIQPARIPEIQPRGGPGVFAFRAVVAAN
jgi:hypothetical protein